MVNQHCFNMARNKYARFFAILKDANGKGLNMTYKELIEEHTNGRTNSLGDLSVYELQQLERNLMQFNGNKPQAPAYDQKRDDMRKAVISQFLSIGRTVQDAKDWAEKYGVYGVKRRFNDYTEQELYQLIRNAEKMKQDHIKSVGKKLYT